MLWLKNVHNYLLNWFSTTRNFIFFNKNTAQNYIKLYLLSALPEILLLDDEPLWEPLDWTFIQSWVMYILLFSWIAEVIITARYGSFTGRDKRVYIGLYRSKKYMEFYFMFNLLVVSLFVIVPFYYEVTYPISYIVSWWDFIDFNFFYKLTILFFICSQINTIIQVSLRWVEWKIHFLLSTFISTLLFFMLYSHSINYLFAFFTDIFWFKKTGWSDFNASSNGLVKWGWGGADRDNFSYHKTTTVFWYKNDLPFASAFFLINFFIIISLVFLLLQWIFIVRTLYSTRNVNYTLINYGVSSINQFFYFMFLIYLMIAISIFYQLMRISLDLTWYDFSYELLLNLWNLLN